MFGKLERGVDLEVQARDGRVDIGEAHLEVLALVPQVGLRLIHDDAAIACIAREQERIDLDVRQDALPLLAKRLGDELLDPKAQDAPALRREERELVAALKVVVVEERGEVDRRVVDGVLAAALFGVLRVGDELLQVDAGKCCGQKAEDRQRGEAPANGGLAVEDGQPTLFVRLALELRARVGDGDQVVREVDFRRLRLEGVAQRRREQARLDGAARLRGHDDERRRGIAVGEQLAHAHGRIGIERLERDAVCPNRVRLVVFRDGHGRLRGSALADEDDGLDAARHHIVSKALNFREVALRAHAQIDPAHKVLGGLARTVGEIIKRCVLGQHTAGDAFLHKRFRRRV